MTAEQLCMFGRYTIGGRWSPLNPSLQGQYTAKHLTLGLPSEVIHVLPVLDYFYELGSARTKDSFELLDMWRGLPGAEKGPRYLSISTFPECPHSSCSFPDCS